MDKVNSEDKKYGKPLYENQTRTLQFRMEVAEVMKKVCKKLMKLKQLGEEEDVGHYQEPSNKATRQQVQTKQRRKFFTQC